jgi:GDSL-like Lipase/Acylhydrolase family
MTRRPGRRALLAALLAAGAAACASEREAATVPPFGAGTVAPPAVAAPPAAGVTIDSVAMVGDSITVGSQAQLEAGFASLGLDEVAIDAENGRRMTVDGAIDSGLEAVSGLATSAPPDLWVIALGTNDVVNYAPEEYAPVIDELLTAVPRDAPIVWVDTYLDGDREASATFNEALRTALARRGQATVVDWASIAGEDGVLSDGIHPSDVGVDEFTSRVVAAVDAWMT